jgi:predicted MFS family arabinose efflux permease
LISHLRDIVGHKAARAIALTFACSGLVFGSWAAFIPYIKDKLGLDEAELGLLLLTMPLSILLINPVSVLLIRKLGATHCAYLFAVLTGIAFIIPVVASQIFLVVIGLFICGAAFGITNVSMNTAASALEESSHLKLIAACHGMWSLGAMAGALLLGFSIIPLEQCCGMLADSQKLYVILQATIILMIIWYLHVSVKLSTENIPEKENKEKRALSKFRIPKELWIIISICLCTYLTEGTITDWSAVFLRDVHGASESIAGIGFAAYALFMAAGRFMGDYFIHRYGNMQVLKFEGYLVIVGLIIIILSPNAYFAIPGFILTGAGISLASPILYQASAKVKGLPPGVGLATMNTFAMAAFLGGPVIIGFVAQLINLRFAFTFVAIMAAAWIIMTHKVMRHQST